MELTTAVHPQCKKHLAGDSQFGEVFLFVQRSGQKQTTCFNHPNWLEKDLKFNDHIKSTTITLPLAKSFHILDNHVRIHGILVSNNS